MKTLHLDLFSGISGDMFLGALIDLGASLDAIETEAGKLGLRGYHLHAGRQQRGGIAGVKFDVHEEHDHHHEHGHADHEHGHSHAHAEHEHSHEHDHSHGRTFAEIRELIQRSGLSAWVKSKSLAIFQRIAQAEGKIHGHPPDTVHFHEVGALDSIIDIVGGCVALELLGRPRITASAVVEGTGWIHCAHGRFPIPAPATLEILGARGIALTQCDEPHELITPTGAALLAELAESFGPMRDLVAGKVGYGLGTRENNTRPNVLRAVLGEVSFSTAQAAGGPALDWETDTVCLLETNLDDCTAETLGHVGEQLLAAGALDVFHTPVTMKKSRPGIVLSVLCAADDADRFTELLLRETSAFGVRRSLHERRKLRREMVTIQTSDGEVAVKLGRLNGVVIQASPEYESCRRVAHERGRRWLEVYETAKAAARAQFIHRPG